MIVLLSSVTWIILSQLQTQIIANFLCLDFYSVNLTMEKLYNASPSEHIDQWDYLLVLCDMIMVVFMRIKPKQRLTTHSMLLSKLNPTQTEGHKSCKCRFLFTTLPNVYNPHIFVDPCNTASL